MTTTTDVGLLDAPDERHVEFALSEQRVIVTQDQDFLRLHAAGAPHPGIAFLGEGSYRIGDAVRLLTLMHDCLRGDEMSGRVEYL